MPHVVLEHAKLTPELFQAIETLTLKTDTGILKLGEKYINATGTIVLIESLAVENSKNQRFFIQLSQKDTSLTVRLLPQTDPEKTPGVKMLMARVAKQIKDSSAAINYGKTNLQDYLLQ
ncbi:hypothetical protein JWG39_10480 [Desulforhopalus vacuolatus]|uniref:hypothetical protein n=1 Tax=Desulforhopalus vacuolatus TaxID=40414 RepID=UPI001965E646|nr:hypothetical protein [Desulforhopalus vacuolatus]MBM9520239.1 hypothetical protein [Desulforhopalus vacuolatus]